MANFVAYSLAAERAQSDPERHRPRALVFFLFDLLFLDGEDLTGLPLTVRKARLEALLTAAPDGLRYNDHQIGQGPAFHRLACEHRLEGIVSKRVDGRYEPDSANVVAVPPRREPATSPAASPRSAPSADRASSRPLQPP
jgi:ATP-dependent DNA ligase